VVEIVERYQHVTNAAEVTIDCGVPPSGAGCAECLATGGWWFHLRRCAICGRIGCCDSSPSQHASGHAHETGHWIVASFEPGEGWFWDYRADDFVDGPELVPPLHHPLDQPVPGPAGRVPPDWIRRLHSG
jgi:Zn-finger in ubiquitin-hydrolases and other protein